MNRVTKLALAAALMLSVGCSSDTTDPNNNNNNSVKVFTATINGAQYTSTITTGAYSNGQLAIAGNNGLGRSIHITAVNLTGAGTYTLNRGNQFTAVAQIIDLTTATQYSTALLGGTGTLTLTTATPQRVTGSFSFIAYTSAGTGAGQLVVTVQNGTFDITTP
jgi:hypothetical protein